MRAHPRRATIAHNPDDNLPPRLRAYGQSRGIQFDGRRRLPRTLGGFGRPGASFERGVNVGRALVNQRRIELSILAETGAIAVSFAPRQWDIDEVLRRATTLRPVYTGSLTGSTSI